MSADEKGQTETPERSEEGQTEAPERSEEGQTETPELSEEGKEQVQRMQQAYDDDRETVALPGTDNTITGVAINDWLDDDGNPKFGKDEQQKKDEKDEQPNDAD
jgi:broad specificity phosphatase PhoE